jgi:hypothetical protein
MRVGFLIERKNYYRLFGPIIERALGRGHEAECWHDLGQPRTGPKGFDFPDAAPVFQNGQPRIRTYTGGADLARRLAEAAPDVMIAMRRPAETNGSGRTPWFGLQYTLDVADLLSPSGTTTFDALGLHSRYWADRVADSLRIIAFNRSRGTGRPPEPVDDARVADTVRRLGVLVGTPEMDQYQWIDPATVRRRLGIDPHRPVVLYIPFPFESNPRTFWVRHIYGRSSRLWKRAAMWLAGRGEYEAHVARGWDDRAVARAVRAFCDANGALFVVKGRAKDPVPRYLARLADRVFFDQAYYPATILELLRISSLSLQCFSTVAYEAAYAGVPSICVAPDLDDLGFYPIWQEWFLNVEVGGSFNFPGVVYPMGLRELVEVFPGRRLEDFPVDPLARAQYVERFVGQDDGKSSDRVLDAVESQVQRGRRRP